MTKKGEKRYLKIKGGSHKIKCKIKILGFLSLPYQPMTVTQICNNTNITQKTVEKYLFDLMSEGLVQQVKFRDQKYWKIIPNTTS